MKVSILIPSYNYARYLPMALDSILKQTFQDFEVIIIDDGSIDNTEETVKPYLRNYKFSYFRLENGGQAKALNYGLKLAKGKYIAFLDSDDIWFENKLSRQTQILDNNPLVGLCYTNMAYMDYTGKTYDPIIKKHSETNSPENLLMDCYIKSPSSVMVRRSVFENVGNFREIMVCHDHDMWVRCIEKTRFYYIEEALVGYRYHEGQLSKGKKVWTDSFWLLNEAMKRYPYSLSVKRKKLAAIYYRLGLAFKNSKEFYLHYWVISALLSPIKTISIFIDPQMRKEYL